MNSAAGPHENESRRLRQIRANLEAIAPAKWARAADDLGEFIEARDEHGEFVTIARFQAAATIDEIEFAAAAPSAVAFLLALLDRAIVALREVNAGQGAPPRNDARHGKDFAAEAAMKCQEPAFKAFLKERHGLEPPMTDERATQRLRSVLGIASRRDLKTNEQAAERWKALRTEFYTWSKA